MHKTLLLGLLALGLSPFVALACSSAGAGGADCSVSGVGCKLACDSTLGCVECVGNSDCGAASPICVVGHCRACEKTSDCGIGEACYPANHTCAPACNGPGTCPQNDAPICDANTGACVGCIDNHDCGGGKPVCEPTSQQCSECGSNGDCGNAQPICSISARECVQCLVDSQCPSGTLCKDHACRQACQGNGDCGPGAPVCLPNGNCGQCGVNADCGAATPFCTGEGRCASCLINSDCPAGTPVCDNDRCVQCKDTQDCANGLKCKDNHCG